MSTSPESTRFNFVSEAGDGIGTAIRLANNGHEVRVWIRDKEAKSVGDNLVTKVGDLEDLVHDADPSHDVFVFDVTGNGVIADALRDRGFAVVGDSILADRLERDREFGYSVMAQCGIDVPETLTFDDFTEARDFVQANSDTRWVYKPSKQLGDLSPSHVSYDSEDLVEMLDNIEKDVDIAEPEFTLQAFEKGVALSTELWFQNGEFVAPLTNHTLERKELMDGDLGPSGGCVGNIVWVCDGCPVCDITKRLVPWAERQRYHGMLDLNVIVSKGGIYGLEFTPRFGYDAWPTFAWELLERDLGSFLDEVAHGALQTVSTRSGIAGGLRVTIPPWPTEKYFAEENVPIRGLGKVTSWNDTTYLYNVKANAEGRLVSAGAWGILMLLTHHAATERGALREPLARAEDLRIKNKQFRTDLADRFSEDLDELETLVGVSASLKGAS